MLTKFKRALTNPLLSGVVLLVSAQALCGESITFNATNGTLSAQSIFTLTGGQLNIQVNNTTAGGTQAVEDVLTAIFFNVDAQPSPNLRMDSAIAPVVVTSDRQFNFGTWNWQWDTDVRNDVDLKGSGKYRFASDDDGTLGSFPYEFGAGTVRLGVFPSSVGGVNYGIIADGTNVEQWEFKDIPLVQTTALFNLSGYSNLSLEQITGVGFVFGTNQCNCSLLQGTLDQPLPPPADTPEPATWALGGIGVLLIGAAKRIRKNV